MFARTVFFRQTACPGRSAKYFDQGARCFQKGYPFRRRTGTIGKQGVILYFDGLRSLCKSLKIMVLARNEFHYQYQKIIQPIKAQSAVQIADGAFSHCLGTVYRKFRMLLFAVFSGR